MTAEELLKALENSSLERLRWRVLRCFGVLPGSKAARAISDEEIIICGAHMVLDHGGRPAAVGGEAAKNASFDEEKFMGLGGGL